jgi:hypothetical protein
MGFMSSQPKQALPQWMRRGAVALALSAFAATGVASSAAAGLFAGMEGSWRGEGSLKWSTGENERMRCTAKYEVEEDGNKLVQNLTCATDSTRLVVKSAITYKPDAGVITGSWSETGYGINGWVTGTAGVGSIQANVQSSDKDFNAKVSVVTRGGEQIVKIIPTNLDVTEVSVTMQRAT